MIVGIPRLQKERTTCLGSISALVTLLKWNLNDQQKLALDPLSVNHTK